MAIEDRDDEEWLDPDPDGRSGASPLSEGGEGEELRAHGNESPDDGFSDEGTGIEASDDGGDASDGRANLLSPEARNAESADTGPSVPRDGVVAHGNGLLELRTPPRDAQAGKGDRDLLSETGMKRHREAMEEIEPNEGGSPPSGDAPQTQEDEASDAHPPEEEPVEAPEEVRVKATVQTRKPGKASGTGEGDAGKDDGGDEGGQPPRARRSKASQGWQVRPTPGTKDDPLLGCLTVLCALLDRNISSEALIAGLPLTEGILSPDLFQRAALRAGISSRLVRRKLDSVNKLALPCVLLLTQQRACVLTDIDRKKGRASVILPEMGTGARDVPYDELAKDYVGYAIFARPEFQYDRRAQEDRVADPKGWFWGTILQNWKVYVEVMIAAVMINTFAIANPLFVMNVYDRVVPNFAEDTLIVLAAGVGIVFLFDFLLKLARGSLVDAAGKSADTQIAARLFQQVLGMKMANRPASAGGLANSLREFEHLREFFTSSTITTLVDFPFIFLFLSVIALIGTTNIVVIPVIVVFLAILVGFLVQLRMRKVVRETFREAQQKHAILIEAISGVETIKATASEGRMQRSWETFVRKTAESATKAASWSQFATTFSGMLMQFVTVAVVFVGVYEIEAGNMSVGALVACTILAGRAIAPLGQIAGIATRFNQARQSLEALDKMMRIPVERPENKTFVHRPNLTGAIEFKNVDFTYPEARTKALDKVSFSIKAGEKVGIIGRIGSGKSTIERLLLGLYEPDEGSVLVDGTDVRQLDPADLRRSLGIVPQDVYLFYGSVRDNIALGAPYADDTSILRAARISGVDEFVSKNPQGLDLPVGERGQSLSGGQRQAIAIARALLLDPPTLMMDEPTSAMDNTSEGRFKARLNTILHHKTLLLVTHRGSLLSLVDRLIVMDGGRIVADGPKESVLEALSNGRIHGAKG